MTSLSGDEKARIRSTMDKFAENIEENMIRYYVSFLTTYPNYIHMFAPLKGATPDPDILYRNEWLRQQGPRFAGGIVNMIDNLDNYDGLQQVVNRLVQAPRHTKHDLKTEDYMNALNIFASNMKQCLGSEMLQTDVDAWNRFLAKLRMFFDAEFGNKVRPARAALGKTYSMPF